MARPSAQRALKAATRCFVGGAGLAAALKLHVKAKGRSVASDLVVFGGGLVADYGVGRWSTPAAYILGGLAIVWVGAGLAPRKPKPDAR